MSDEQTPEPTDEQLDELLERFAAEQPGEIDEDDFDEGRFRAMMDDIVENARDHPRLGAQVRELESQGAHLYMKPLPDHWIEIRLGFEDDPVRRPKSHGRSFPLGKFPLSRILRRPQG